MLEKLSKDYVRCFDARDLKGVGALLNEDFSLKDPNLNISGKAACLEAIAGIFSSHKSLEFVAQNIFVDETQMTSLIEFTLKLDALVLEGVVLIKWQDGKMSALRAYLNPKS